jgi:hypothetical protein
VVLLLLRFPAAAGLQEVKRGGAPLVQYRAGVAGVDELAHAGLNEGVWEGAGSEVRCSV